MNKLKKMNPKIPFKQFDLDSAKLYFSKVVKRASIIKPTGVTKEDNETYCIFMILNYDIYYNVVHSIKDFPTSLMKHNFKILLETGIESPNSKYLNLICGNYTFGIPKSVIIECIPTNKECWIRIQSLALNPRLRLVIPSEARLSDVIKTIETRFISPGFSSIISKSNLMNLEIILTIPEDVQLKPIKFRLIEKNLNKIGYNTYLDVNKKKNQNTTNETFKIPEFKKLKYITADFGKSVYVGELYLMMNCDSDDNTIKIEYTWNDHIKLFNRNDIIDSDISYILSNIAKCELDNLKVPQQCKSIAVNTCFNVDEKKNQKLSLGKSYLKFSQGLNSLSEQKNLNKKKSDELLESNSPEFQPNQMSTPIHLHYQKFYTNSIDTANNTSMLNSSLMSTSDGISKKFDISWCSTYEPNTELDFKTEIRIHPVKSALKPILEENEDESSSMDQPLTEMADIDCIYDNGEVKENFFEGPTALNLKTEIKINPVKQDLKSTLEENEDASNSKDETLTGKSNLDCSYNSVEVKENFFEGLSEHEACLNNYRPIMPKMYKINKESKQKKDNNIP
ncbi:hypothetical protein A3Q56_06884 [Intoshia linei]|uniref:Uncharacterized protein n=1 Tax=Intoshia linei TaxID=1819745 RepID=A0A177AV10_9BILA|nr:hypothetical protein A3Q56_06884 [Intoshia linei]